MGGWGEAWGGGPWRAGKGGDGGCTREQCKGAPVKPNNWSDLAGDEGGGMGGRRGEVAHGGRGRGGDGGTREQCGSNKRCPFDFPSKPNNWSGGGGWGEAWGGGKPNNWSDLAGEEGGGMGGGVGRWPMEGGQGGRGGGPPESSVGATKGWGGWGRRGEVAHGGRARGGEGGGGTKEQCGSNKNFTDSPCGPWGAGKGGEMGGAAPEKPTGRGWGDGAGVGRWPMEGGQGGEMGGVTREQCGSNKKCISSPFYDLAGDEGGGGGRRGEVAHGGRSRDGGGGTREQCGYQLV